MDQDDIEHIYRLSKDKIEETDLSLKRYSYDSIDWRDRLVGLRGARGDGQGGRRLVACSGEGSVPQRARRDAGRDDRPRLLRRLDGDAERRALPRDAGSRQRHVPPPQRRGVGHYLEVS